LDKGRGSSAQRRDARALDEEERASLEHRTV
jgi:hypothetical protein